MRRLALLLLPRSNIQRLICLAKSSSKVACLGLLHRGVSLPPSRPRFGTYPQPLCSFVDYRLVSEIPPRAKEAARYRRKHGCSRRRGERYVSGSPIFRLHDGLPRANSYTSTKTMETKYTQIETTVPIIPHTIKAQLTPSLRMSPITLAKHTQIDETNRWLARLNATIAKEVQEVLDLEMPSARDWTEINIHERLVRIVAIVSGRIFIGPELCRTEKYLDAAINYTIEVMAAVRAVQELRPWQRPFLARRLPQVKKLQQRIDEADEFLRPVVELRKKAALELSGQKPDDMLQWLIDGQDKFPDKNSQNLAKVQLGLSFAAIHTTTLTATNAFVDPLAPHLRA